MRESTVCTVCTCESIVQKKDNKSRDNRYVASFALLLLSFDFTVASTSSRIFETSEAASARICDRNAAAVGVSDEAGSAGAAALVVPVFFVLRISFCKASTRKFIGLFFDCDLRQSRRPLRGMAGERLAARPVHAPPRAGRGDSGAQH